VIDGLVEFAAEPSAAVGIAALASGAVSFPRGATVVCVVSGGNFDPATLRRIL
jgi:threonine dehydratase